MKKRLMAAVLSVLMVGPMGQAYANCMDEAESVLLRDANRPLFDKLAQFLSCSDDDTDPTACNVFLAKAANAAYGVDDFKKADGTYMTANEISAFVQSDSSWSELGLANVQANLDNAAAGAQDHLIIATMLGDPHGHVALIVPGAQNSSGGWHLNVPNSAAFTLNDASKAYVFCKLSYAFRDPAQVHLWWRLAH